MDLNMHFPMEDTQISGKHKKGCFIPLSIGKMQIKQWDVNL
jgi:hypothetical protein